MPRICFRGFFFGRLYCEAPDEAVSRVTRNVSGGENLGKQLMPITNGAAAATVKPPIPTIGEVFPDGSMVELIGGDSGGNPRLMLWDGVSETIGPLIQYGGVKYEPTQLPASVVRELKLPTQSRSHRSTRQLLAEICKLVEDFVGLPATPASLVGRFVLCSWLVEAMPVAPALVLVGPDLVSGNQLVALLHCLCRRGLRMTGLTPAGMRSLPSGAGFTFLISQPISDKLAILLDNASCRDRKIPHRGGLLDLFGAQVIHAESMPNGEFLSHRSIAIPMIPRAVKLSVFDHDFQQRVTVDFQAKLVNFRRANLGVARKLQFDSSKFAFPLRMLAHDLAAATPNDAELQDEVFDLLREKDDEIRADRWTALSSVAIEALHVADYESPRRDVYVAELAAIAQEISSRRGGDSAINPGAFGKRLKLLGFHTEPRDAKGIKLRLTEDVSLRCQQLAREFGIPKLEDAERGASRIRSPRDVEHAKGTRV